MIVFVIEINGGSILVFNADSQLEAEQHAVSPQIRSDLMVYETADSPLWNGQDEIIARALAVFPCPFRAAGHAERRAPHPSYLHRRNRE